MSFAHISIYIVLSRNTVLDSVWYETYPVRTAIQTITDLRFYEWLDYGIPVYREKFRN